MATQNVVAGGGRATGGSTVSPTESARQTADNTGGTGVGGAGGADGFQLPELDATVVDALFAEDDSAVGTTDSGYGAEGGGNSEARGRRDSLGAGPGRRGFHASTSPYSRMGWDLGWNSAGSNITRGSAAFGVIENTGNYSEDANGQPRMTGPRYRNLMEVAKFAEVDPEMYRNPDGTINEDGLKAAVDTALKDYYRVSGDTGGIPGATNAQPGRFASAIYRRDGDRLVAVNGTARLFDAPDNSAGHFAEYVAPVASILAAPILGGMGVLGQTGSLTTGIASATGMSPFWSNIIGTGLVRGGLSAAGGGSFGRGALTGAIGAGVTPMIAQGAAELAGPGTTGASLLTGAGNLGLSAILSGGNITPMGAVSSILSGFGRGGRNNTRTR